MTLVGVPLLPSTESSAFVASAHEEMTAAWAMPGTASATITAIPNRSLRTLPPELR